MESCETPFFFDEHLGWKLVKNLLKGVAGTGISFPRKSRGQLHEREFH